MLCACEREFEARGTRLLGSTALHARLALRISAALCRGELLLRSSCGVRCVLPGSFQPQGGQVSCFSCSSLGDYYQDLSSQTACNPSRPLRSLSAFGAFTGKVCAVAQVNPARRILRDSSEALVAGTGLCARAQKAPPHWIAHSSVATRLRRITRMGSASKPASALHVA